MSTPEQEIEYRQHRFSPPPGARVTESTDSTGPDSKTGESKQGSKPASGQPKARSGPVVGSKPPAGSAGSGAPRVVGTGWTSVVVLSGVTEPAARGGDTGSATGQLAQVLDRLPRVSGTWGSGRLMSGKLFSVLLTDDGRLLVGAVSPELLYAAAGQR